MTVFTEQQIREKLRDACKKAGSQKEWASQNGLSESYVSDVIRGKSIGDSILEILGYSKRYIKKQP